MTTPAPQFSIVIPAYNVEATIDAAIASALGQEAFDDLEVVVVDDGSTDATRARADAIAARDARVRVLSQSNAGAGAAISAGIRAARGEFLVQLGADDELLPQYAATVAGLIEARPDFDIYASNAFRLLPDGRRAVYHTGPRFQREMSLTVEDLLDAPLIYGAAAFRREWFDRVGGFRAHFYNEDYDFWLRAMIAGARHVYTPEPLALYRVRPGQKTADGIRMRTDDIAIMRDAVASGGLSDAQVLRAERTIARLERNVRFRKRVTRVLGPALARPVFALVHRLAWLVRPYRRLR
jgi:glycosyltransferase involved in cell wall biosynthesis